MILEDFAKTVRTDYVVNLETGQTLKNEVDKMNADEIYEKYLTGNDIKGEMPVCIRSAEVDKLGEQEEEKIVVYFNEIPRKGVVLNKTNKDAIKQIAGTAETNDWIGKVVVLYTIPYSCYDRATKKTEMKPVIRIKAPIPKVETEARAS